MRMKKKISKEYICKYLWDFLIKLAESHRTVFYCEIRDNIRDKFGVRYSCQYMGSLLSPIQDHCLECCKPPLTALVVSKRTGLPGEGFIAEDIPAKECYEQIKNEIFAHNWKDERCPFLGFDDSEKSVESYALQIVKRPDTSKDVWRKVKDRGQCQKIFREGLLMAYDYKCAVCGLSFTEILQAAHIQPWSKAAGENKISVNNGLLLCPNHHALYDSDWMTISKDYIIGLSEDSEFTKADKDALIKFIGKKIRLPKDRRLWPSPELLKKHTEEKEKK